MNMLAWRSVRAAPDPHSFKRAFPCRSQTTGPPAKRIAFWRTCLMLAARLPPSPAIEYRRLFAQCSDSSHCRIYLVISHASDLSKVFVLKEDRPRARRRGPRLTPRRQSSGLKDLDVRRLPNPCPWTPASRSKP